VFSPWLFWKVVRTAAIEWDGSGWWGRLGEFACCGRRARSGMLGEIRFRDDPRSNTSGIEE
jgi:hypothetical protein